MYLIVYRTFDGKTHYSLSYSRNAIKHLKFKKAKTVWVYDNKGWWLSFADTDKMGKPYRPKMYPDGEPREFYKNKFIELTRS